MFDLGIVDLRQTPVRPGLRDELRCLEGRVFGLNDADRVGQYLLPVHERRYDIVRVSL